MLNIFVEIPTDIVVHREVTLKKNLKNNKLKNCEQYKIMLEKKENNVSVCVESLKTFCVVLTRQA